MSANNSYSFDASTGVLTQHIKLDKHLGVHHVNIVEHNHAKKKVHACQKNPPKDIDGEELRSGRIENGHIANVSNPREALLYVVNSHKIKARKDSHHEVTILGSRAAIVQIGKGHGVTIHNSTHRWQVFVERKSLKVVVVTA